jgi:hypothetical protein
MQKTHPKNIPVLKTGCKAYYDSLRGLVPVVVRSVTRPPGSVGPEFFFQNGTGDSRVRVSAMVSSDAAGYRKGEIFSYDSIKIVPQDAVYCQQHHPRIAAYSVAFDA